VREITRAPSCAEGASKHLCSLRVASLFAFGDAKAHKISANSRTFGAPPSPPADEGYLSSDLSSPSATREMRREIRRISLRLRRCKAMCCFAALLSHRLCACAFGASPSALRLRRFAFGASPSALRLRRREALASPSANEGEEKRISRTFGASALGFCTIGAYTSVAFSNTRDSAQSSPSASEAAQEMRCAKQEKCWGTQRLHRRCTAKGELSQRFTYKKTCYLLFFYFKNLKHKSI